MPNKRKTLDPSVESEIKTAALELAALQDITHHLAPNTAAALRRDIIRACVTRCVAILQLSNLQDIPALPSAKVRDDT